MEERILQPRRDGSPVTVLGRTFRWDEIRRVRITVSAQPSSQLIARIRSAEADANFIDLSGTSESLKAATDARDVTDELIQAPPGASEESGSAPGRIDSKNVMVVHGRETDARRAMFDFLRALGLRPREWGTLVAETGKAAPYVGEVLEKAFEQAAAVVVLFTPDDEARLREHLLTEADADYERKATPQARPNVLFEAGMALGVHPNRTVLVEVGRLRPFSDIYGRHVVRLDGTEGPLRQIAARLETAGCAVDASDEGWADPRRFPEPYV